MPSSAYIQLVCVTPVQIITNFGTEHSGISSKILHLHFYRYSLLNALIAKYIYIYSLVVKALRY